MKKVIGPYEITQRTEYSKLQVTDKNGSKLNENLSEKIINDYNLQIKNKDKYFKISGNTLDEYIKNDELDYIFVPDGIKKIANKAFKSCKAKLIYLPHTLTEIGHKAFKDSLLEEINIPTSVELTGESIFSGCKMLKKVTLPDNLESIPVLTFEGCNLLEELILPDTVKNIYGCAFSKCNNLKKINIPRDLEFFGEFPFVHSGITTLTFNHDLNNSQDPKIAYGNFLFQTNITKIEISPNVNYIDPNLFKYTKGIKELIYLGESNKFKEFRRDNTKFIRSLGLIRTSTNRNLENLIENDKPKNIKQIIIERINESR